jgi:cobalt-zinc-cadmium efflux system protein
MNAEHAEHDGHHGHGHTRPGHGHGHSGHGHSGHGHSGHGHAHRHTHRHAQAAGKRALGIALVVTATFCAAEAAAGFLTGSLALLSDATHMLTDALGLAIAFIAASLRTRARAGQLTFGLRRLPVLGGLFNALLVLGASAFIVVEAVERIGAPREVPGLPVIVVASAGLLVNLFGAWLMHRSGDHSVNMRGAMLHMIGDALGSVAALVSGIVLLTTSFTMIDPLASLVVAGIVTVGAVRLIFDVGSILLERAPAHVDIAAVERAARRAPGVDRVIGLHAWELDSGEAVASLVLVTNENDLARLAATADELRGALLEEFRIAHATIEWRPQASPRPCCGDEPLSIGAAHPLAENGEHGEQGEHGEPRQPGGGGGEPRGTGAVP